MGDYEQYKKEQDRKSNLFGIKKTFSSSKKLVSNELSGLTKRQSIRQLPSGPIRTNLSKEQAMLSELFGQKNQFWGGNDVVRLNRTLQGGDNPSGLIKSGDEGRTRRLMLP